jgi:serine protease inhibitor
LPKFEVEYDLNLKDVLTTLGMGVAFEKGIADFTKLGHSPQGPLYISRVMHKVKLGIDEYGAEGAAATAVVISADSAPPSILFDRPFYFVLRHVETQALLFIGLVGNP